MALWLLPQYCNRDTSAACQAVSLDNNWDFPALRKLLLVLASVTSLGCRIPLPALMLCSSLTA